MNKSRIGMRIKEERKKHNYTLESFSEKVGIGRSYMSDIERGIKMPSLNVFERIVNALEDVSADYLLRDFVVTGRPFVLNALTEKMTDLSPRQLRMINDIIDTIITNYDERDEEDPPNAY